ncbi:MAG: class I SAM-dependent methyltransferase [Bacteroidota bacterium]
MSLIIRKLQNIFVKYIYADHNSSSIVKEKLNDLLKILDQNNKTGLNVGAGDTKIHPRIKNLDIISGHQIDIVGFVEDIPCPDESFDLVVTQECLEHVKDPFKGMNEMYRVLKKGGKIYLQLPFIIGYHPGPTDFWRFTVEGIEELAIRSNFNLLEKGIVVGGGSGYYRISVEFFAVLFSIPFDFFYKSFKVFFALLLFPLKAFDYIFRYSHQKNRIPGGFYLIAQK